MKERAKIKIQLGLSPLDTKVLAVFGDGSEVEIPVISVNVDSRIGEVTRAVISVLIDDVEVSIDSQMSDDAVKDVLKYAKKEGSRRRKSEREMGIRRGLGYRD